MKPFMDEGWLEMTLPHKPTSSQQKYRLTPAGPAWLDIVVNTGTKKP